MPQTSKRLVLFTSNKGGVGSTTSASLALHFLREQGRKVAAADCDGSVGRLARIHGQKENGKLIPDALNGVDYLDIFDDKERDRVLGFSELDCDVVLLDLPSSALTQLGLIFGSRDQTASVLETYTTLGFDITIAVTITPDLESLATVRDALSIFGDNVSYVVIENQRYALDRADWGLWDGCKNLDGKPVGGKSKATMLEKVAQKKAAIIQLPLLRYSSMLVGNINGMPLHQVATDSRVTLADKARINRFLAASKETFLSAGELLGFQAKKSSEKAA